MQNETVARRYATAIFGLAKERNAVPAVGRDLHAALQAIQSDDTARRFFMSPVVDRGEKQKAFATAFASLDEVALHAVLLLDPQAARSAAGADRDAIRCFGPGRHRPRTSRDHLGKAARSGRTRRSRRAPRPALRQNFRRSPIRRARAARRPSHHDGRPQGRRNRRRSLDELFRDLLAAPQAAGAARGPQG